MFTIGNTSYVLGVYRLIKSLRILAEWMTGLFLVMLKENVLSMAPEASWGRENDLLGIEDCWR